MFAPHPSAAAPRLSSYVRVILGPEPRNHTFVVQGMRPSSRLLDGLDPAVDPQLGEQAGGVGLDRVLGDEEPLADLPVAQPLRDEPEDLVLALGDSELLELPGVEREWLTLRDADLFDDHHLPGAGQPQPEVDAHRGEDHRHQSAIDLGGIGADEVLGLQKLEQREEHTPGQTVQDDAFHRRGA